MARYLLTAPDEDMERWKAVASERGLTFAKFLRMAAEYGAKNVHKPFDGSGINRKMNPDTTRPGPKGPRTGREIVADFKPDFK